MNEAFQDSPEQAEMDSLIRNIDYNPDEFREFFTSPFEQYKDRIGKRFIVLGRDTEAENDLEVFEHMYRIQFKDGTEITAWGHEVCVLNYDKCGK